MAGALGAELAAAFNRALSPALTPGYSSAQILKKPTFTGGRIHMPRRSILSVSEREGLLSLAKTGRRITKKP